MGFGTILSVDLSNNVVNKIVNGMDKLAECGANPMACGINCKRFPTLAITGGFDCATLCTDPLTMTSDICMG